MKSAGPKDHRPAGEREGLSVRVTGRGSLIACSSCGILAGIRLFRSQSAGRTVRIFRIWNCTWRFRHA